LCVGQSLLDVHVFYLPITINSPVDAPKRQQSRNQKI
jgi:hypothetical protein